MSKQESYKIASSGFKRHFAKTESIPLKILASLYSVNGSAPQQRSQHFDKVFQNDQSRVQSPKMSMLRGGVNRSLLIMQAKAQDDAEIYGESSESDSDKNIFGQMFMNILPQFWLVKAKKDGKLRTYLKSEIKVLAIPLMMVWVGGYDMFGAFRWIGVKKLAYLASMVLIVARMFGLITFGFTKMFKRLKYRYMKSIVRLVREEVKDFPHP